MPQQERETCWTLVRGAATGRSRDREEFARRYMPIVRAYLSARWEATSLLGEIDDVVQEVFLACFREGGVLDRADSQHGGSFRALLYRVSRNIALHAERTRARRRQRIRDGVIEPDRTPADELTLSRVFDRAYARSVMREARNVMVRSAASRDEASRRRVELLRLRFEEGLPIRDIAKRWNEDATHLHREFAKASREFKAALAEAVTDSEGCPPARLDRECERLLLLLRA